MRVLGIVVLVLAVLVAVPVVLAAALFDPDAHKGEIEAIASRALGRRVAINGRVTVESWFTPSFAATEVTVANAPGGSRPEMLRIGRVEADLALRPLLAGNITLARLVLLAPDLLLERDAAGLGNWRRVEPAAEAAAAPPAPAASGWRLLPRVNPQLRVRSLHVRGGALAWRDAATGLSGSVLVSRLSLTEQVEDTRLTLAGELVHAGQRVELTGETAALSRLLDPAASLPVNVVLGASGPGLSVRLAGAIDRPAAFRGYRFRVDAHSPDLAQLAWLLPPGIPALRNVALTFQVAEEDPSLGGFPQFSNMRLAVGPTDLDARVPGLKLDGATVSLAGLNQPLLIDATGALSAEPLKLAATLGPPAALMPQSWLPRTLPRMTGRFPLNVALDAGSTSLSIQGGIADPVALKGLEADIAGRLRDLEVLGPLVGRRLPPLRDVAFAGHVADTGGLLAGLALRDAVLESPQGDVRGSLTLDLAGRPSLRGTLASRRLDVDALRAALAGRYGTFAASAPADPPRPAPPDTPRLAFSEAPFDLRWLDRGDADLTLTAGEIVSFGTTLRDLASHAVLKGARLDLDPIGFTLPGGRAEGAAMLAAPGPALATGGAALRLRAPGLEIKPLLAELGSLKDISGTAEIDLDLRGTGASRHALAASVAGRVAVAMADGEIDQRLLVPLISLMLRNQRLPPELIAPVRTKLRCLALNATADHGLATVTAFTLDAGLVQVQASGSADLGAETVDLALRPMVRVGPGVVLPVRLAGPLANPQLQLGNEGGRRGGGVAGLIAGALAAAGAGDKGDACGPALAAARAKPK